MKSLTLFNALIQGDSYGAPVLIKEYNVILPAYGAPYLEEVKDWLREHKSSNQDMNNTFWRTWKERSDQERFIDQMLHYATTYGQLTKYGSIDDRFVCIPQEDQELPEPLVFEVIPVITKEEAISRCLTMLSKGAALKSETVKDIMVLMEDLNYSWTGKEEVQNKEAKILIYDKMGILPETEELLFRYLFYKATNGQTLVIKNRETINLIKAIEYKLPHLSSTQLCTLAQGFNRRKPLYLAMKKANGPLINKLSKLSKRFHKPMPRDILGTITWGDLDADLILGAIERANPYRLVRLYNVLKTYANTDARYYRIRNGKGWATTKSSIDLSQYCETIKTILGNRLKQKLIHIPEGIDYAIPTSEKMFLGNTPIGTKFSFSRTNNQTLLLGIVWKDNQDLDLHFESNYSKVGWNSTFTTEEIMHSGDITGLYDNAVSAAEYGYFKGLKQEWQVCLVNYRRTLTPFNIVIGTSSLDDIPKNYIINPDDVIFDTKVEVSQYQVQLGLVYPEGDKIHYILDGQGSGSHYLPRSQQLLLEYNQSGLKNMLRIRDLINSCPKDEAALILDIDQMGKDVLLNLFD